MSDIRELELPAQIQWLAETADEIDYCRRRLASFGAHTPDSVVLDDTADSLMHNLLVALERQIDDLRDVLEMVELGAYEPMRPDPRWVPGLRVALALAITAVWHRLVIHSFVDAMVWVALAAGAQHVCDRSNATTNRYQLCDFAVYP